ncbi:MAG TPA: hypothetical protein VHA37_03005 [Candidatus Saccharimonadales bacterium]|nr:hypothetical protein [Candidatus Saccharimonadales bacterium]
MSLIQLILGITAIGVGIARRHTFGWYLVIAGGITTWGQVWLLVGGRATIFGVVGVLLALALVLGRDAVTRPERLRETRTQVVLLLVALLAIVLLQTVIPERSVLQKITAGALIASYIGMLASFSWRVIGSLH